MQQSTAVFAGMAVLAALVVGATVALVPTSQPGGQSLTSYSTSATTGSTGGLVLSLSLNASVITRGNAVSLNISEFNGKTFRNSVQSMNLWPTQGLGVGPCGPLNYPFGFEVFSGYFNSSSGMGSAQKVQLYQTGVAYSCPMILGGITSYVFYPLSNRAEVIGPCGAEPCFTDLMSVSETAAGYWNGTSWTALPLGIYTVMVGDEWGTLLFGHFQVVSAGSGGLTVAQAGTSFQVASSYDCVAGHTTFSFDTTVQSIFTGGFDSGAPGVSMYVATLQQESNLTQGHPSSWKYSTGLVRSSQFSVPLPPGMYVAWFEGADLNCGAQIVTPLEQLTAVNVTGTFEVWSASAGATTAT